MSVWIRRAMFVLVAAALAVATVPNQADAQMAADPIKARQALMKSNGKNMRVIVGFMKKGMGSAADVAASARNIVASASVNGGSSASLLASVHWSIDPVGSVCRSRNRLISASS